MAIFERKERWIHDPIQSFLPTYFLAESYSNEIEKILSLKVKEELSIIFDKKFNDISKLFYEQLSYVDRS
jgi:hypothetical protein